MGEERQLELEFCELHRLFRATVPRCASAWQPVELQAGSSLLALFWRHVGWFDGFEGALTRPDDEAAPAELSAMLEQWRTSDERGDGSYDRVHELLPARYRVISLGDETVTLADETGGELDPPVAVLYGPSTDAEGPGLERLPQNYLATVTALLLESVQFETVVKGTLTVRGLLRPEVLPSLLPGSVCLDEAWLLACSPPSEPTLFELRASSVAQVVELLTLRWTNGSPPTDLEPIATLNARLALGRLEWQERDYEASDVDWRLCAPEFSLYRGLDDAPGLGRTNHQRRSGRREFCSQAGGSGWRCGGGYNCSRLHAQGPGRQRRLAGVIQRQDGGARVVQSGLPVRQVEPR